MKIAISEKTARTLLEIAPDDTATLPWDWVKAITDLRRALEPRKKSSQVRATEKKRRKKSELNREVWRQASERLVGWNCEACETPFSDADPPEQDHFFGRGKAPTTIQSTWLIHRSCHRRKTNSEPTSAFWLDLFYRHAAKHGYHAEAAKAQARLDSLRLSRESEVGR